MYLRGALKPTQVLMYAPTMAIWRVMSSFLFALEWLNNTQKTCINLSTYTQLDYN